MEQRELFERRVDHVEIDVEIENETKFALLVYDGTRKVWIPKSQLIDFDWDAPRILGGGRSETITIPEWLARSKGLI